jgi:hypothetical protein
MKKVIILNFLLALFISACGSASGDQDTTIPYLGQTPPDTIPQIFAPGIISLADRYEFGSTFSKDGTELYFGVDQNFDLHQAGRIETWSTALVDGKWEKPEVLLSHPDFTHNDPMLSPDESKLYFISSRPLEGNEAKDIDIWYVERIENGWSSPKNVGSPINSTSNEYYVSFAEDGALYFSSNANASDKYPTDFDIYKSDWENGVFQKPVRLPKTINTLAYEGDAYVAPDESFIIFCATRRSGYGRGDLYISFKDESGNWTKSRNMGSTINDENHQLCPFVTHDGKYFFYTSNKEIYWVSTDIFKSLR